jgi:hypothetical protein
MKNDLQTIRGDFGDQATREQVIEMIETCDYEPMVRGLAGKLGLNPNGAYAVVRARVAGYVLAVLLASSTEAQIAVEGMGAHEAEFRLGEGERLICVEDAMHTATAAAKLRLSEDEDPEGASERRVSWFVDGFIARCRQEKAWHGWY